jgi:hypothetical protein
MIFFDTIYFKKNSFYFECLVKLCYCFTKVKLRKYVIRTQFVHRKYELYVSHLFHTQELSFLHIIHRQALVLYCVIFEKHGQCFGFLF